MRLLEKLERTKFELETRHWGQGAMFPNTQEGDHIDPGYDDDIIDLGTVCLTGACALALDGKHKIGYSQTAEDVYDHAGEILNSDRRDAESLLKALEAQLPEGYKFLEVWNDNKHRTREDVVALVNRAYQAELERLEAMPCAE